MNDIQYIMVTKWKGHWDVFWSPIKDASSTLFTHGVIDDITLRNGPWPKTAKTLFIKLNNNDEFEKSWIGISKNFKADKYKDQPAVRFEVSDLKEVICPEKFRNYKRGWYINTEVTSIVKNSGDTTLNNLNPPFFEEMQTCSWPEFEKYCYYLLRLLGIHNIHAFPHTDNRGKADGFFRFQTLTVIYDATLEINFFEQKEQQIENYVNQLKKEKISFASDTYTIKDTQKQVWIITRGKEVKLLKTEDHIKVKEIPFTKLIEIYNMRLEKEIGLDEFWDTLKDLK